MSIMHSYSDTNRMHVQVPLSNLSNTHHVRCRQLASSRYFKKLHEWHTWADCDGARLTAFYSANWLFNYCSRHDRFEYNIDIDDQDDRLLTQLDPECNTCRTNLVLHLSPDCDDIRAARIKWAEAHETHQTAKLEDDISVRVLDRLSMKEYETWVQYTFCCFNMARQMRQYCLQSPDLDYEHKLHFVARHRDSICRDDLPKDRTFCSLHSEVGDAWPWRYETGQYNQECFICFESSRRQSLKADALECKAFKPHRRLSTHMFASESSSC